MPRPIRTDPNDFSDLEQYVSRFDLAGRSKSIALLLWFLDAVYRLDEVEAQDAVCDKQGDGGLDAIVVDDAHQEIVVFQSKRRERLPATLGDVDLKTFIGSLSQISTSVSVEALVKTTRNEELRALLNDLDVAGKVKAGYKHRAIFITNVAANEDALAYIQQALRDGHVLEVWDTARLSPVLKQLKRDWFVPDESKLKVDPARLFAIGPSKTTPDLVYVAIRAKELVALPGIDDSRIFAQNVRLGLGSTRVNDDILSTVKTASEHARFLTFHNGLTIVAKTIRLRGGTLRIRDFSVCNGCQSLLTFYNNRRLLSDDLQVLVRIVKVGDDRRLPEVIAYRTNNQNPISLRDLASNDVTQVRLKTEFDQLFGRTCKYGIKRGEEEDVPQLPNELAGRLLLALYVGEPWSTHQKYRIFGDLESKIFSYHVSAKHIRLAQLLYEVIAPRLAAIDNQRLARYGLTHLLLLFLLGELMRLSPVGKQLLDNPIDVLSTNAATNPKEAGILAQASSLVNWVITELNYAIKEWGGDSYDYKREFKSPKAVTSLRDNFLKAFEKDRYRGRALDFTI
jgi:hypothetical protein